MYALVAPCIDSSERVSICWVQEKEERLKERLHEMAEYQSNDFSFKVAHDLLIHTPVNQIITNVCSILMYVWCILQDSDLERALRKQEDKSSGAALQRWRWFYVALIGITVALLSMVVNLGIAGLNSLKIKTTERIITDSGGTVHQTIACPRPRDSLADFPI